MAAIVVVATLTVWRTAAALDCEGIPLDDGCLFTITGGDTADPDDGFAVTNADSVPLWSFVRKRDLYAIGYPISQRWVNGPFTLQAFQKVILQWDPGKSRMNYYNTLDVLANRYPDVELPNVPSHQVLEADRGADVAAIRRNHLALLDQNAAIKARFLSEPDWLNLYGLPIRYEEREVNGNPQGLQLLRAQRMVFEIWNVPAPGTTVGRVNLQNVPDKVKRLSNVIIPDAAKAPVLVDEAAELPMSPLQPPVVLSPPTSDREVLVRLYHATDGPNWDSNTNWLSDAPLSDWKGVSTDVRGRVIQLFLGGNNLRGSIPPELGNLTYLQDLSLHGNSLTGHIPPELGNLAHLDVLWLEHNALTGPIPPELGQLTNLTNLLLWRTELTGPIPVLVGDLPNLSQLRAPQSTCILKKQRARAIERRWVLYECESDGRLLPSVLMREDSNGVSIALPDDLRKPSGISVSHPSVVAASVADGWLELTPHGIGTVQVELLPSDGGESVVAEVVVRPAVGTFGIDIVVDHMGHPAPLNYAEALMAGADWWSRVLDGTEWPDRRAECSHQTGEFNFDDNVRAMADELVIRAFVDEDIHLLDILAHASTCFGSPGWGTQVALDPTAAGVIGLDQLAGFDPEVIVHEIGHILGLVLWGPETGLVSEDRAYFIGPLAVSAFRASGGDPGLPGMPTDGLHWGGDFWYPFYGAISVAALADAGYTVAVKDPERPNWP